MNVLVSVLASQGVLRLIEAFGVELTRGWSMTIVAISCYFLSVGLLMWRDNA